MRHKPIQDPPAWLTRPRGLCRRALRWSALLLTLCAVPLLAGCRDSGEEIEGVITREQFVQAYSELRVSALRTEGGNIVLEERDRILAELSLTSEDLFAFVEAHGRDISFMLQVWEEVDHNLETRRNAAADSLDT